MAAPQTLEDYLGIGEQDPTLPGVDPGALPPASESGAQTPPITTPGGTGTEATPPTEITDPGTTGATAVHSHRPPQGYTTDASGNLTVAPNPADTQTPTPTPSAPTPASTDYSQLNTLLASLLQGQQGQQSANADYRNNIKSTILSLIKSGSAPVDPNDPTIASATQAFRGEGERALALLREKQAEASRAGGRTAGSEESAVKGGYEDLGNAIGAYTANLQVQELNARRQQLMQAASLGAGVSNSDESNALQAQIAQIDAQLKELSLKSNTNLTQQGITNQNTQFYDNLANNMGSQTNTLDELLSTYLLGHAA